MDNVLDLAALRGWCSRQAGGAVELLRVLSRPLPGGYGTRRLVCHELEACRADGRRLVLKVAQKHSTRQELAVMQALAGLGGLVTVDEPLASAGEADGEDFWFAYPWHEGRLLTFDDDLPGAVIDDLARVHVHFAGQVADLARDPGLERVDAAFLARFAAWAQTAVAALEARCREAGRLPAGLADLAGPFRQACVSPVLAETLAGLPPTLLHGDVHPGNIVAGAGGRHALIDWGNARLGPALLDIANLAGRDSVQMERYQAARLAQGGQALAPGDLEREHAWATAMLNLQYLPWACEHQPDWVPGMLGKIVAAHGSLAALAEARPAARQPEPETKPRAGQVAARTGSQARPAAAGTMPQAGQAAAGTMPQARPAAAGQGEV